MPTYAHCTPAQVAALEAGYLVTLAIANDSGAFYNTVAQDPAVEPGSAEQGQYLESAELAVAMRQNIELRRGNFMAGTGDESPPTVNELQELQSVEEQLFAMRAVKANVAAFSALVAQALEVWPQ